MAVGVTYRDQYEFPFKKFYWCLSTDYTFKEFPDLNDQHREFIDRDDSFFIGEPNRKLIQKNEDEQEEPEENQDEDQEGEDQEKKELDSDVSEQEEIKVPVKDLVEIDRVKYVVFAIENDC